MKESKDLIRLHTLNNKLKEENEKLQQTILYIQKLSEKYNNHIQNNKTFSDFTNEIANLQSPFYCTNNTGTANIDNNKLQWMTKELLSSKSVGALPIQSSPTISERIGRSTYDKTNEKIIKRKSRSPSSKATQLLKRSLHRANSSSIIQEKLPEEDLEDCIDITNKEENENENKIIKKGKNSVVIIFRPEYIEDKRKFIQFISSYANMMEESHKFEWYQGQCSIKKHGNGTHYIKGEKALCGTWENNNLIRKHHDYLPEELLTHHLDYYHNNSIDKSKSITSPIRRRKAPSRTLSCEQKRCLFDSMLPEELRILIFSFLDLKSLLRATIVSTEWKRLTNDPILWCSQHVLRWGGYRTPDNIIFHAVGAIDWQDAVKTKYLLDRNWKLGDYHATTLRGHSGWVTCVDMHNNRLVSSSYDGTVRIWNTQTGNSLQTFPAPHQEGLSPVWCAQFKGNTIMSGSSDSLVRQWNMATGQCVHIYEGHAGGVKCLQYDAEKSILLSGSDDKTVKLFDVRTGNCEKSIQYSDSVGNLHCNGPNLLTVIKRESNLFRYDLTADNFLPALSGHSKAIYCLDYNEESNYLVTGSRDRDIKVWDLISGECIQTLTGHQYTVMSVRTYAGKIVSGSADQTIKIWDLKSGICSTTIPGHTEVVMSVKFDDTKIVSGSADRTVVVWDFQRRSAT